DFLPTLENTREFYPPETQAALTAVLHNRDPAAAAFDLELPFTTATGRSCWARWIGRTEFRPDGTPERVHGAAQDVTAHHESETARRELEAQLFQAQKMDTLGTLAGGIAHDFNNLLTGIIGFHELAADFFPADHPARPLLGEARGASLRARALVEQILTFGRRSPGGAHVPLDLGPVVEEARRFLRSTLPAMITIELRLAPGCPPVFGDATQIHQVLLNLGSNAGHAMRARGGTLVIEIAPAAPTAELALLGADPAGEGFVRLSVTDDGHGMDEATRRRIFDPFFTTKNTREGTGLGLAVVHGIVRTHGGTIHVDSKPGEGAAFHIYLPVAPAEQDAVAPSFAPSPRGAGELVAIVDDEELVAQCAHLLLENNGYTTATFGSATEALAAIQAEPARFALLVTDETMPYMQGTELIAAARKIRSDLPVVIMSGYFSVISPETFVGLGQAERLPKPFTNEELNAAVHRALQSAAVAGDLAR
ncbi:MAG: hypothetical protein RLZZ15_460, partial [Verrucomicrobiota bacterium]